MSKSPIKGQCALCGRNSMHQAMDRGNLYIFIDCENELCGEYIITRSALDNLDEDTKRLLSQKSTSKNEILQSREILYIHFHDGIKSKFENFNNITPGIGSFYTPPES